MVIIVVYCNVVRHIRITLILNKEITMNTQYTSYHRGYKIMANEDLHCINEIMDAIVDSIEGYTSSYSRTFVVNFGLNYPQATHSEGNKPMQMFMDRFKKYLTVRGLRHVYVWVREQKSSDNPHYHCLLLLDGRKIQNSFGIMEEAKRLWGAINDCDGAGLVHYPHAPAMLRTDSQAYTEEIEMCVFHTSYLAKKNTKGSAPCRQREYGYSRKKPWE